MSEIRRERLSALRERELERFVAQRPLSTRWLERSRPSMPNGVPMAWMATMHEHPPIVVESGSGAAFTDIDGHRYRPGSSRSRRPRPTSRRFAWPGPRRAAARC
jgi:glutamate-1-semialdehyde 2,1-aminomutase